MLTVFVTYHYFLGLRNLSIITNTLRAVQKNYGKNIEMDAINLADKDVFANIFAKGLTNSVFQFESPGMKGMLMRFRPESIEDLILLVAAYRPGPLQYLDSIIETKSTGKKPEYVIPAMEDVLGVTYGKPIYQEQVMSIFNKFAGFSLGESDIIRRYMSKKKTDKFMAYHDKFIDGMMANGATREGAEDFWLQLVDFSKYAFNKSHACAYAITAYYTGYLKYHYPKEYAAAVANYTEFEKIGKVIEDARSFGAHILNPDVNLSNVEFDTLDGHIRYGLSNIKNVASAAYDIIDERNENGMFKSFEEFMERTACKRDVAHALISSGALDCLASTLGKTYVEKRIAMYKLMEEAEEDLPTNDIEVLGREMSVLGAYVTANPAAGFKAENMVADAQSMVGKTIKIAGAVQDLQVKLTRKGQTMAVFNFVDAKFDSIEAVCFGDTYLQYEELLKAGVCHITGTVQQREEKLSIMVRSVKAATSVVKAIVLTPETKNLIKPYVPYCNKYKSEDGVPLLFNINDTPKPIFSPAIKVSTDILKDEHLGQFLTVTY